MITLRIPVWSRGMVGLLCGVRVVGDPFMGCISDNVLALFIFLYT